MVEAVESRPGTNPDRASFTVALHAATEQVITAQGHPRPARSPDGIAQAVLARLLPARRARTSARLVKCPILQYTVTPARSCSKISQRITSVNVTLHARDGSQQGDAQGPVGFRELTLRLLRTEPDRAWRTVEISRALGITTTPKYRSLCTQINRWAEQAMLIRESRGRYRLAPEWLACPVPQRST